MVEAGADVDIPGEDGLTPLHYAARFRISQLVAETGGLVSSYRPGGETDSAVRDPVIRFLAEQGASINQRDRYGLSPLHYACMRGNPEAVQELISLAGIAINGCDDQSLTPLHMACTYGHADCAQVGHRGGALVLSTKHVYSYKYIVSVPVN